MAVTLVALLAVGATLFTSSTRGPVLAADPLADARAQRDAIERQLNEQQAKLDALKANSANLATQLASAEAALAAASADYERVAGLLKQVTDEVEQAQARVTQLLGQIADLDAKLRAVSAEIVAQTDELTAREALLQDHLRTAYEQSQTSLLEILLSSNSLDAASNQVGYLLTLSEQDQALADEIRTIRDQLNIKQTTLRHGRNSLREARVAASSAEADLKVRKAELKKLEKQAAALKAAAEKRRAEQEAALNAALAAQGNVAAQVADSQKAADAANALVGQLEAQQAALEEARRRAEEEARKHAQEVSARGFRWPENVFRVTQEWGPTSFVLEPPYTYHGTYYRHFHAGIDLAGGCNTPILAAGTGVVVASGRPLWPWDSGYGVVIDHGNGVQTWYWHLQPRVYVNPGQPITIGSVIGYEGSTGNSTGCHLHFAVNDHGVWENPRWYLP
jgi:murein DD-endopeptidase MepM/ murein hydrolase activator NlpD